MSRIENNKRIEIISETPYVDSIKIIINNEYTNYKEETKQTNLIQPVIENIFSIKQEKLKKKYQKKY